MKIKRNTISRSKYNKYRKELISIAELSGSICFIEIMLTKKQKCWENVKNEMLSIQNKLDAKLDFYYSRKNDLFNQRLIEFAKAEMLNCKNVIAKYQTP